MMYPQSIIDEVLEKHSVEGLNDITNGSNIFNKNKGRPEMELMDVSGDGFKGKLLKISNAEWIRMGISDKFGKKGQRLGYMAEDYNALAAINASGFVDPGGQGKGETPVGIVIQDGKILYDSKKGIYNIIGFDENNALILGSMNKKQIREKKIRDAAEFGPFLIINGKAAKINGNGGMGLNPRTAIAQTKDGAVLFLVIDGRQVHSVGATVKHVQKILLEHGAYNAANLDGGSSSSLRYNGKLVNKPSGPDGERFIPNAFMVVAPDDYNRAQAERQSIVAKGKKP